MSNQSKCSKCNAFCCVNPPQLSGVEEVVKALSKRSPSVIVSVCEMNDGNFIAMVEPENRVCPFIKDNQCSIHDDHFKACGEFNCKATEEMLLDSKLYKGLLFHALTFNAEKLNQPDLLTREEVDRLQLPIKSRSELIDIFSNPVSFIQDKLNEIPISVKLV